MKKNPNPTAWLLEEDDPSVRYFTLKDLLGKSGDDPEVLQAKREIMQTGTVPEILRLQRESAYLQTYPRFYTDKYRGLAWQLIVLAELGAAADQQIQDQCEYIFRHSQEPQSGGFAMHASAKQGGGRATEVIPCLTGNMVWSLTRFGYWDDPRLQKGIDWITRTMRFDDGANEPPQGPAYDRLEMCWGRHTCHMGVVKTLKALAAIPEERRSVEVNDTIRNAAEFLLIHHIHKRSHDVSRVAKPGWLKLSFPLLYQTDVLEILDILSGLGIRDTRMDEAVGVLLSKRDETGRWRIEYTKNSDRLLVPAGQKGEPSKWVTLRALRVLKRFGI